MKRLSIFLLLFAASIKSPAQNQKQIVHYNLFFAPDLSNRLNNNLYRKAVNDADIVESILNRIWNEIGRMKRDGGQKDHYGVDFINKGLIGMYDINTDLMTINLQRFDRQIDRINYVMARHNVSKTLAGDIKKMVAEYRRFNTKAAASPNGADIWTYFQSGLDARIILPDIQEGRVTHKFRNVMVLMTDGYIEAGIFNKGFDLSDTKVTNFRKAFLAARESNLETFLLKNPKFKIKPVKNAFLKNLEVIVIEMYDRSLSKTGAATKHPTDMEVLKLIWSDWLRNSGVKRFELKSIVTSKEEAVKYVMDFIQK